MVRQRDPTTYRQLTSHLSIGQGILIWRERYHLARSGLQQTLEASRQHFLEVNAGHTHEKSPTEDRRVSLSIRKRRRGVRANPTPRRVEACVAFALRLRCTHPEGIHSIHTGAYTCTHDARSGLIRNSLSSQILLHRRPARDRRVLHGISRGGPGSSFRGACRRQHALEASRATTSSGTFTILRLSVCDEGRRICSRSPSSRRRGLPSFTRHALRCW